MTRLTHIAVFLASFWFAATCFAQGLDTETIEPPMPIYKVDPKHPEELFVQGVEGEAIIIVTVDLFGSVADPVVDTATHEEFGLAALLAASEWIFEPATRNGVPIEIRAKIPFKFSISFEHRLNIQMGREVFKKIEVPIIPSSELDRAPLPSFVPAFVDFYPEEFRETGKSASLSIEFIIAPDGHVHNPRVTNASASGFNQAALRAVANIKYQPIEVEGIPAYVSMLMPIQMSE
ncbi:MAG: TonB family protein [Symploca sp. SIO2D2]|nr:TonB family protein [Symploca sp. SIO2D2]